MAGFETALSDTSDDESRFLVQALRKTVSQESGISTLSDVSYQPPPERTSTPIRSNDKFTMVAEIASRKPHSQGVSVEELRVAIMKGCLNTVRELYLSGIDVNAIFNGGWTALMYACSYGQDEIVSCLVENGADALAHKDMFTALMAACASRRDCESRLLRCCKCVVDYGAEVNAAERHLMTSLMFAARENRSTIVLFLLENGADINAKDCRNWTPLCFAAYAGHSSIVSLLLANGADPNIVTLKGHTAFDIAEVNGKRLVSDQLRKVTKVSAAPPRSPIPLKLETVTEESAEHRGVPLSAVSILPKPTESTQAFSTMTIDQNDDLQLFLSEMNFLEYLPLFQKHKVDFHALLLFEATDFERLGILELGVQKKLQAGILNIHKQPWTKESLLQLQTQNLTCSDVRDMLINFSAHLMYMRTSLAFMLREMNKDATALEKGVQDIGGTQTLFEQHAYLLKAANELLAECDSVQRYFQSVSGYSQYNVIRYGKEKRPRYVAVLTAVFVGTGIVFIVKKILSSNCC